jgi:hypothetical protein
MNVIEGQVKASQRPSGSGNRDRISFPVVRFAPSGAHFAFPFWKRALADHVAAGK